MLWQQPVCLAVAGPQVGPDGPFAAAALAALEEELARTRKELAEVRKELAAKTVQLSRKEAAVTQERVAELAASVAGEKERQLAALAGTVEQLEAALAAKEEVDARGVMGMKQCTARVSPCCGVPSFKGEGRFPSAPAQDLEEARRLYTAQKRALREALSSAAEAEAAQRLADEAHARTAVAQVGGAAQGRAAAARCAARHHPAAQEVQGHALEAAAAG
jgi:hypothetical protein